MRRALDGCGGLRWLEALASSVAQHGVDRSCLALRGICALLRILGPSSELMAAERARPTYVALPSRLIEVVAASAPSVRASSQQAELYMCALAAASAAVSWFTPSQLTQLIGDARGALGDARERLSADGGAADAGEVRCAGGVLSLCALARALLVRGDVHSDGTLDGMMVGLLEDLLRGVFLPSRSLAVHTATAAGGEGGGFTSTMDGTGASSRALQTAEAAVRHELIVLIGWFMSSCTDESQQRVLEMLQPLDSAKQMLCVHLERVRSDGPCPPSSYELATPSPAPQGSPVPASHHAPMTCGVGAPRLSFRCGELPARRRAGGGARGGR